MRLLMILYFSSYFYVVHLLLHLALLLVLVLALVLALVRAGTSTHCDTDSTHLRRHPIKDATERDLSCGTIDLSHPVPSRQVPVTWRVCFLCFSGLHPLL